ncbi:hypothetical protein QCD60_26865 [Pokkaliibacter sp. MBI-7]|uniref:hypothetical protein n=1 Tax=Pokkaliibacter sp. MBI-7 TaxID=3040600 RepID=UPI002449299B|nr:hypothetical protein [Pokkaliibacter sp. MBI-7]MDH2436158.1 hypothetical protein [Pokkaliibacter sp. MBI-7]
MQQFTKSHKAEVSACEHCGSKENLESAHVHGRNRNEIIDLILKDYTYNSVATVDIERFEDQFKDEHFPLEKSILILCQPCHKNYDNSVQVNDKTETSDEQESQGVLSEAIRSRTDYLPITLDPGDPELFKQELLVTKLAEIETTYKDGRVETKKWNATNFAVSSNILGNLRSRPEFRSGNWQDKDIVKVHVRIKRNA